MIAATHTGTCQLCGKRHMLPEGKLAKHGYTLTYGFFNGTCRGSDELPFEQSKDLAQQSLDWATAERDRLLKLADEVNLAGNDDGTVWFEFARPLGHRGKQVRVWEKGKLEGFEVVAEKDGKRERHYRGAHVPAVIESLQESYADSFRRAARQGELYIEWQEARCKDWKPADLQPVENENAKKTHVLRYRDGSGYVARIYGRDRWDTQVVKTEKIEEAARYTERGAKQALGKARGYKTLEVVGL